MKHLYTIDEACRALEISRATLYRLINDGKLEKTEPTTTYPRGRVYVTGASIRAYRRRQAAERAPAVTPR